MALLHFIIARETAVKKKTDDSDIRIRIPLHIMESLPLANKMTAANNSRAGQGNYGKVEIMHLLRILERVNPIGSEEWTQCTEEHRILYPGRCKESIKRKYATLYRKGIPTGDPNCPEEVRLAKKIKWAIGARASIGDGDEEFNLEETTFNSNDNDPDPDPPPLLLPGPVADPPLLDDDSYVDPAVVQDESMVQAVPPRRRPVKRSYRGKDVSKDALKQDFFQLYHMQFLQQQQDREDDRKARAEERREDRRRHDSMMSMIVAMMAGQQPSKSPPPPPPRLDDSDSDGDDVHTDDDVSVAPPLVAAAVKRAPPVAVGVVTRRHKKKRGLGNSTLEVSDFI